MKHKANPFRSSRVSPSVVPGRFGVWLAMLSGVILALAMPPFDQAWAFWVGFVPLLVAVRNQPISRVMGYTYLTGLIYFTSFWYSVFPWGLPVLLCICLSFPLFFVIIMSLWAWLSPKVATWVRFWILPLVWVATEYIFVGWLHLPMSPATTQAQHPLVIQGLAVVGPLGLSFLIISVNAMLAEIVGSRERSIRKNNGWLSYGLVFFLFLLNLLYGAWVLQPKARSEASQPSINVFLAQPAKESKFYQPQWRLADPADAVDLAKDVVKLTKTLPPPALGKPEVIVWPEGGSDLYNLRLQWVRVALYSLVKHRHAYLAVSSIDLSEEGRLFNSIYWISPEGRVLSRYDKHFLVPVGEASFTSGKAAAIFKAPFASIGPMICAESNFPQYARELTRQGADLLLISANDASFRRSGLPFGHTRMAIVRAVESRRPVLLCANVGPSLIVDPYGCIQVQTRFWQQTVLGGSVTPVRERSLYHRFGYLLWPFVSVLVFILIFLKIVEEIKTLRPARLVAGIRFDPNAWLRITAQSLAAFLATGFIAALIAVASIIRINQLAPQPMPAFLALSAFVRSDQSRVHYVLGPQFRQATSVTCGSAALAYLISLMGKPMREEIINKSVTVTPRGINLYELKGAAEKLGFLAWGERQNYEALRLVAKPLIAHVGDNHYVVVTATDNTAVELFDPGFGGLIRISRFVFERVWDGVVLLVRPKPVPDILATKEECQTCGS